MKPKKIEIQEIALAMEMRTMGIPWKYIARELKVCPRSLVNSVHYRKNAGIKKARTNRAKIH
jgi:hypothetical protein